MRVHDPQKGLGAGGFSWRSCNSHASEVGQPEPVVDDMMSDTLTLEGLRARLRFFSRSFSPTSRSRTVEGRYQGLGFRV